MWALPCSAADGVLWAAGTTPELIWNEGEFTEGVAVAPSGDVFFSDIGMKGDRPGRILQYSPATNTTSVFIANSGQSNGLFFNRDGQLLACCGANGGLRCVCIVKPFDTPQTLVDNFQGAKLNAPNDLVVHPAGFIFFSDPRYIGPEPLELKTQNVWRIDRDGSLQLATAEVSKPNGVILSPDAKTLYVAETDNGVTNLAQPAESPPPTVTMRLSAFSVGVDGSLGDKRVLVDFGQNAGIDGMTVDLLGNIYAARVFSGQQGIVVYSPAGTELDFLPTPQVPTNCAFGVGETARTLYITAGSGLYRAIMLNEGYHPELAGR